MKRWAWELPHRKGWTYSARRWATALLMLAPGLSWMVFSPTRVGAQVIAQIVPASGPTTGGNVIRLLGSGFTSSTSVWIWANQASLSRLVSSNELDVIAPAHNVLGAVDVVAGTYRVNGGC